jgi:hypothetical protein
MQKEQKASVMLKRMCNELCLCAMLLFGTAVESLSQPLARTYAEQRLTAQRNAMWILGAWAGASILSGVGLSVQSENTTLRYLGFQNIGWGAVNAAIAVSALFGLSGQFAALDTLGTDGRALLDELSQEQTFAKILLVNTGLDVGYMLVGAALMWGARNGLARSEEVFGSGLGVVIQGAFLLVFDIWQVLASGDRTGALENAIRPLLSLSATPFGTAIKLTVSF